MSCEDAERHTVYVVQHPHSPDHPPRQLREGDGLTARIESFAAHRNTGATPFAWVKIVNEILARAVRELPATPGDVLALDSDRRHKGAYSASPTFSDVGGLGWTIDEAEVGIAARLAVGHGKVRACSSGAGH